jgi:RNA recognition motif-containing protein
MFDAHRRPRKVKEEAPLAESEPDTEGKQKKDACIRKVRLGTFEDSGLCKGWAFVDFTTVAEATAALTNPHNYELDGRTLKVEYASADAVRRGAAKGSVAGAKPRPEQKVHDKPLGKGKYDRDTRVAAKLAKPDRGEIATPQDDHAERPAKRQKVLNESEEATRQSKAFGKGSFDRGGQSGLEKGRKVQEMRRGKDGRMRPAPGAALAMAKRESVGIVPSQGTKIKF